MKPTTAQLIESASVLMEPIIRHVNCIELDHPDNLNQRQLSALAIGVYVLLQTAQAGEAMEEGE